MSNADGSFEKEKDNSEVFATINTIDQTVFVERLPNPMAISRGSSDIIKYGTDNLYPNKVKSMAERSQSTSSAIGTLSDFSAGQGFENETLNGLVINDDEQTLFDILDHMANERAEFAGLALHFNYNIFGQIIEIQEIPFETIRYKKDFSKLIFCPDWSRASRFVNKEKIDFDLFNPDNVQAEIEEAKGIENYKGQILYWIPKKKQIYTLCRFDPALDDSQFEHEAGVYKLRNIQNDYSAGYLVKYPAPLETELEKTGLINDTKKSKGAKNAGKVKLIPLNSSFLEALGSAKMIEEIPRTGIDKMFTKQNDETKDNIFSVYNQPPILNGIAKNGMFNQESFMDAFDYYNSKTKKDRDILERIMTKFMSFSIWNVGDIKIKPLEFVSEREKVIEPEN